MELLELRRYVEARGLTGIEYVDTGVSGAKDRRPALDQLVADVRRHRAQGVVCWRLDPPGRNLRDLVLFRDEWQSRRVAFVTLGRGTVGRFKSTKPAGPSCGFPSMILKLGIAMSADHCAQSEGTSSQLLTSVPTHT